MSLLHKIGQKEKPLATMGDLFATSWKCSKNISKPFNLLYIE